MALDIEFKRLSNNAKLPTKLTDNATGFVLYAAEDVVIEPGAIGVIKTDIAINTPGGYSTEIRPLNRLSLKTKFRVIHGTVDEAFIGNLTVIADNLNPVVIAEHPVDGAKLGKVPLEQPLPVGGQAGVGEYPKGTYMVRKGDAIAQLVLHVTPATNVAEVIGALDERGRTRIGWGDVTY